MSRPKWVVNKHKNEFHRVVEGVPQPSGCQLDEVPSEHRVEFKTAREAMTSRPGRKGADACAYCTKKFKSRH